jgi:hypothetical protein
MLPLLDMFKRTLCNLTDRYLAYATFARRKMRVTRDQARLTS